MGLHLPTLIKIILIAILTASSLPHQKSSVSSTIMYLPLVHYEPCSHLGHRYAVTDLTLPAEVDSNTLQAIALSNTGLVAGTMTNPNHGFVWQNGIRTDLGTLGGDNSLAWAVNDQDQVVGDASTSLTAGPIISHAFRWQNGVMRDLGTLGGLYSYARGINTSGQIVGGADTAGQSASHAFLWQDGVMKDLDRRARFSSIAWDINIHGQVVGDMDVAAQSGFTHAFLWQNGRITDLGTLPGTDSTSYARAINDTGAVIGYAMVSTVKHAVMWQNGQIIDLGSLGGYLTSAAADINNQGQIVGFGYKQGIGDRAFLWDHNMFIDLNQCIDPQSGWELHAAFAINDAGQVLVDGRLEGKMHSLLLTPIPLRVS